MLTRHRRVFGRAAAILALGACFLVFVGPGGAASHRSQLDDELFPCGTKQGPRWTVPGGRTGTDWALFGIDENASCTLATEWVNRIGSQVVRGSTTLANVFRIDFRGIDYGCIAVRSILIGVCRQGNGGHGSLGVLVIGNAAENPYTSVFTRNAAALDAPLPLHPPTRFAFPSSSGAPVDCNPISRRAWEIRRKTGDLPVVERGTTWRIVGDQLTCDAIARTSLPARLAIAAYSAVGHGEAIRFTTDDGWACIAARTIQDQNSTHTQVVTGVPVTGCARYLQPFGNTAAGFFQQFTVIPQARAAADHLPVIRRFGITATIAFELQRDGGSVLGGGRAWHCGGEQVIDDVRWSHGSESREKWLIATSGGYPCHVATAIFKQFLARQALIPTDSGILTAVERDDPWRCTREAAAAMAMCTFDARAVQALRELFGLSSSLKPLKVGIIGSYSGAQAILDRALTTSS